MEKKSRIPSQVLKLIDKYLQALKLILVQFAASIFQLIEPKSFQNELLMIEKTLSQFLETSKYIFSSKIDKFQIFNKNKQPLGIVVQEDDDDKILLQQKDMLNSFAIYKADAIQRSELIFGLKQPSQSEFILKQKLSMKQHSLILYQQAKVNNQKGLYINQLQEVKKLKKKKEIANLIEQSIKENEKSNMIQYHFTKIIEMKSEYKDIQVKLFQQQRQNFWLFNLTNQQIQQKIMEYKEPRLKKIIRKWRKDLVKRNWKVDQICFSHQLKIFYLCQDQTLKPNAYLCNQCIQYNEEIFPRQIPSIICKTHRKPIKYKLITSKEIIATQQIKNDKDADHKIQQAQSFMCQQCLYFNHQKYAFISSCHFQVINQLCLEQKCIQTNNFMICPVCDFNDFHLNHRRVCFNRESLMEQFKLQDSVNISLYQQQLIKAKEILKLNLFQKIRISFVEQILQTMRFLESLAIYDNEKIQKWIECLMTSGKKEDLMVLRGALEIKQMKYAQADRLSYLQALNYMIQHELQITLQQIWLRISQFCKKINQFKETSKEQIERQLNQKYNLIIDTETENKVIVYPMRLNEINPIHFTRIKNVIVIKEMEEQRDQIIRKEWRSARRIFFTQQIKRKLCQSQINVQSSKQIMQLFMKVEQDQQNYSLQINLDQSSKLYKYQSVIQSLSQSYCRMNELFRSKLKDCLPFTILIRNQFINFKSIHIQYNCRFDKGQQYSIDSQKLFLFIHQSPQLQTVKVKGVHIQKINQFISSWNPVNFRTNKIIPQCSFWERKAYNFQSLKISLDFRYQFRPDSMISKIQNFMHFRRQFKWLSDVTFVIQLNDYWWADTLATFIQSIRGVKQIKIEVKNSSDSSFKQFLLRLASFTEIISLRFEHVSFIQLANTDDYSTVEKALAQLFQNNTIASLSLNSCSRFPILPKITTLQQISLTRVKFREQFNLNNFINENPSIKFIKCSQIQFMWNFQETMFDEMQQLFIKWWKNISFDNIVPSRPSKLKSLSLIDSNIGKISLQVIFPKLIQLTELSLEASYIDYQMISVIPSNYLRKLSISRSEQIIDKDLQLIDSKWPYLRKMQLKYCAKITQRFLSFCKFKSLIELKLSLQLSLQGRKYLRKRGIIQISI